MTKQTLIRELRSNVVSDCACQKMREAARKITRSYDKALRPTGLRATQFTLLSVVALNEDNTLTELAENQGLERTTLLRNLQPLARKGLIEMSSPGNGRARYVKISADGVAVMEKAVPLWRLAQDELQRKIGTEVWDRMHNELWVIKQFM